MRLRRRLSDKYYWVFSLPLGNASFAWRRATALIISNASSRARAPVKYVRPYAGKNAAEAGAQAEFGSAIWNVLVRDPERMNWALILPAISPILGPGEKRVDQGSGQSNPRRRAIICFITRRQSLTSAWRQWALFLFSPRLRHVEDNERARIRAEGWVCKPRLRRRRWSIPSAFSRGYVARATRFRRAMMARMSSS